VLGRLLETEISVIKTSGVKKGLIEAVSGGCDLDRELDDMSLNGLTLSKIKDGLVCGGLAE